MEDLETHLIEGPEKTGDIDAPRLPILKFLLLLKWFTHHINMLLFPAIKIA